MLFQGLTPHGKNCSPGKPTSPWTEPPMQQDNSWFDDYIRPAFPSDMRESPNVNWFFVGLREQEQTLAISGPAQGTGVEPVPAPSGAETRSPPGTTSSAAYPVFALQLLLANLSCGR
jgi:hypothetical protein